MILTLTAASRQSAVEALPRVSDEGYRLDATRPATLPLLGAAAIDGAAFLELTRQAIPEWCHGTTTK